MGYAKIAATKSSRNYSKTRTNPSLPFVSLNQECPIVSGDVDTPPPRKLFVHGVIVEKRMKWFAGKEIFSLHESRADISWKLAKFLGEFPVEFYSHTSLKRQEVIVHFFGALELDQVPT